MHSDFCWRYIPDVDDWEIIGNLNEAASAPAHDYSEAFGFAIAHHEGPSFEVTLDGVNFELLAPYPNTDVMGVGGGTGDDGCLVVLDEKNVFLAGGRIESDDPLSLKIFLHVHSYTTEIMINGVKWRVCHRGENFIVVV